MEDSDSGFLDWFAGFVAGEGCLWLHAAPNDARWRAGLSIALRDDDLPILLDIQERLKMGTLYHKLGQDRDNPQIVWGVQRSADCIRLVEIFDKHPIRAKKQADFEIWREAVGMINRGLSKGGRAHPTYDRARLRYLHDRLRFVKTYRSIGDLEAEPPDDKSGIQLSIWGEDEEFDE